MAAWHVILHTLIQYSIKPRLNLENRKTPTNKPNPYWTFSTGLGTSRNALENQWTNVTVIFDSRE